MEILKEKLSCLSGGRILDVGTGRGEFLKLLQESFKDYTEIIGIDISDRLLAKCREEILRPNVSFYQMDAANLEFPANSFDTVAISNSLHHMSKLKEVLFEMKRVLKPGGLFLINEMIRDHQSETQLSHLYLHHWAAEIDRFMGIEHSETFLKREIAEIAMDLHLSCLEFCEYADLLSNPKAQEEIDQVEEIIRRQIERLRDHPESIKMRAKGEELLQRVREIGISSCTQVIITGVK